MEALVRADRYRCGKRKVPGYTHARFAPGDHIEFLSTEGGGTWKPGVVADDQILHPGAMENDNERVYGNSANVRIVVGVGVTIVRPKKRCRMAHGNIPIDVVPGSNPPRFRWKQVIVAPDGQRQAVAHESNLPASCERAVAELIVLYKGALRDNALLSGQVDALNKRVAGQDTPVAEATKPAPTTTTGKRK